MASAPKAPKSAICNLQLPHLLAPRPHKGKRAADPDRFVGIAIHGDFEGPLLLLDPDFEDVLTRYVLTLQALLAVETDLVLRSGCESLPNDFSSQGVR